MEWNPQGKKTILSIDGGGMRGTLALAMLAELEQMTGKPAYELFDLVGGTSTGAIIATGLGIHLTAQQILEEIYKVKLPSAFNAARGWGFWLRWLLRGTRYFYPDKPFLDALLPYTKGKKMSSFSKPAVFMTTKDVRTGNTYYIVSQGKGAAAFADWPISGAVAASGSAPIFFPPVLGNLIDGGVGVYGNPCLGASIEAVEYMGWNPAEVMHISLGTGYPPNTNAEGAAAVWSTFKWVEYNIIHSIFDAALQQVFMTRAIYSEMDFRRYNMQLTTGSVAGQLSVPTDGKPDPATLSLDSVGADQINFMEEIGRAYARKIDWSKPNVMPWDTIGGHEKPGRLPVRWENTPYL